MTMYLLVLLVWLWSALSAAAHTNPYILGSRGASAPAAEPFWVALETSALTGGDNLDVDIPMERQIVAVFLKKQAAASDLMFRTSAMAGDNTATLTSAGDWVPNCIQSLGVGTIQLGSDPECNASGATFYILALSDFGGDLEVDTYVGTGSAHNEPLTAAWTPAVVMVAGDNAGSKIWATPATLSQSCHYPNNACTTNHVTSLNAGSFGVGTLGTVNTAAITYAYLAVNAAATTIIVDTDTRTGNNTDNQTIPFGNGTTDTPFFVVVAEDEAEEHGYRFASQTGDTSFLGLAAQAANCIQGFSAGSWELGNSPNCNASGIAGFWWGIGEP